MINKNKYLVIFLAITIIGVIISIITKQYFRYISGGLVIGSIIALAFSKVKSNNDSKKDNG